LSLFHRNPLLSLQVLLDFLTLNRPCCHRIAFLEKGNPGLGCYPADVLKMESTAILCAPHGATLFSEIGFSVGRPGEKPV
jgi:hypothetical protein